MMDYILSLSIPNLVPMSLTLILNLEVALLYDKVVK